MAGIRISTGGTAASRYPPRCEPRCELLPPEAFPDTRPDPAEREAVDGIVPAETGANSRSVRVRLASSCAGWSSPPSAAEFHAALRALRPDVRQCAIVRAWAREATSGDVVRGWLEEAYSWPILVASLQYRGGVRGRTAGTRPGALLPERARQLDAWRRSGQSAPTGDPPYRAPRLVPG